MAFVHDWPCTKNVRDFSAGHAKQSLKFPLREVGTLGCRNERSTHYFALLSSKVVEGHAVCLTPAVTSRSEQRELRSGALRGWAAHGRIGHTYCSRIAVARELLIATCPSRRKPSLWATRNDRALSG